MEYKCGNIGGCGIQGICRLNMHQSSLEAEESSSSLQFCRRRCEVESKEGRRRLLVIKDDRPLDECACPLASD